MRAANTYRVARRNLRRSDRTTGRARRPWPGIKPYSVELRAPFEVEHTSRFTISGRFEGKYFKRGWA